MIQFEKVKVNKKNNYIIGMQCLECGKKIKKGQTCWIESEIDENSGAYVKVSHFCSKQCYLLHKVKE